eukprot:CAMPEP_0185724154 /NCGR_PEP_ID=MMETSP1171-20130828/716_1 /TAXON_ID=374046 /ORGANISM="Helicotheca tamensis, Strain CCMP826" /LENGTH=110 /DNA_ID=CAMNT_0028391939 /DNA_START=202 /DNA_END=534 /DNA_ORIENTATION=-
MNQPFGVDAPDGQPDDVLMNEKGEIKNIIDIASMTENAAEIEKMHKDVKRTFAVDAPDGDSDGHVLEEMTEIEHLIDEASEVENTAEINKQHSLEEKVIKEAERHPEHDW